MASNGSDRITVSPELLQEMASQFQRASQETSTQLDELKQTAQQLISDMYSQLKYSPDALQQVCNQFYKATNSEADFLREVAQSLNVAAANYRIADDLNLLASLTAIGAQPEHNR